MTYRIALVASLVLVAAAPSGAQSPAPATTGAGATSSAQPSSSTAPPSSTAPSATTAPSSATAPVVTTGTDTAASASKPAGAETDASTEPSPELLRQARLEGFRPKKRNGVTKFCQTSAQLGTRFETETCVDEAQLKNLIHEREDQRNVLRQQNSCTGCNGH